MDYGTGDFYGGWEYPSFSNVQTAEEEPAEPESVNDSNIADAVDDVDVPQEVQEPQSSRISEDVESDDSNSKKRAVNEGEDEDDGALCPICMDNWTSTGDHRICALRCGHLFGHKCLERWLESLAKKTCPTCKKKVSRNDVRFIYARKLTAMDTSELDNVRAQLDEVRRLKSETQLELNKSNLREAQLQAQIQELKQRINQLQQNLTPGLFPQPKRVEFVKFRLERSLEICKFGNNRVFDTSCRLDLLTASTRSPTNLFDAYGLRKICMSTYRPLAFIPNHSSQIRDISFHPENDLILTASMDKTFKVTDNNTNAVTHQFEHTMPLWSCCWDLSNHNVLYTGTQNGNVVKYDMRKLLNPVQVLTVEGDLSPVVSVSSIPGAPETPPGIISCKLNSLWFYEDHQGNYKRHVLPLEGPFISMKYQADTRQLLVSSRPNSRVLYSRHTLCNLSKEDDQVSCNIVHTFQGGGMQKLLSKSCFVSSQSDYVAAHDENRKSICLWSVSTGLKVAEHQAKHSVLDLKGIQNGNGSFLISLTERRLDFCKFV